MLVSINYTLFNDTFNSYFIFSETMYEKKKVEIFHSNLRKNVFRPKQHVYVNVFRETHNNV